MRFRWKLACAVVGLLACFPFGTSRRRIPVPGRYHLVQSESGSTYRLFSEGGRDMGGGILDGIVVRIGWNDSLILAERAAISKGDGDGWMLVNVASGEIAGPLSDSALAEVDGIGGVIEAVPVEKAWEALGN